MQWTPIVRASVTVASIAVCSVDDAAALLIRSGWWRDFDKTGTPRTAVGGVRLRTDIGSTSAVIWVVDQKSLKLTGTIKLPAGVEHQMAVMP